MKFSDMKLAVPGAPKPKTVDVRSSGTSSLLSPTTSSIQIFEVATYHQEPLVMVVYGAEGCGKSRLMGTAPSTIGVIPMERKSRRSVVQSALESGKRVVMPQIDLIRTSRAMLIATMPEACIDPLSYKNMKLEDAVKKAEGEMQRKAEKIPLDGESPSCCQRCYYRWHANRTKYVGYMMAAMPEVKTICIDTFGQFIDDILFANYGRNERIMPLDRKTFNREVSEFINDLSHKNLILSHHAAQIWKDNKPTSKTKPQSSFSKIGHYVSVVVKMSRNEDKAEGEGRYTLTVEDCQARASLIGMELLMDDQITFKNLAMQVYEDSTDEDWE